MQPLISVVIPTLPTRKKYLERAINSVKKQTYSNIEIITETRGNNACEARNLAIGRASGEFIAFLDDDDTWETTKIEKQVKHLQQHDDALVVICFSNDLRRGKGRVSRPPRVVQHPDLVKGFNLSSTSSYLVRKSILEKVKDGDGNYFDPQAPSGHEYDLALRITHHGNIHCIQEILMTQYKSEGQISENWGKKVRGQYFMMEKWGHEYHLIDYIKRIGLVGLFWMGNIFGDKIMIPINFMKEVHEQ